MLTASKIANTPILAQKKEIIKNFPSSTRKKDCFVCVNSPFPPVCKRNKSVCTVCSCCSKNKNNKQLNLQNITTYFVRFFLHVKTPPLNVIITAFTNIPGLNGVECRSHDFLVAFVEQILFHNVNIGFILASDCQKISGLSQNIFLAVPCSKYLHPMV